MEERGTLEALGPIARSLLRRWAPDLASGETDDIVQGAALAFVQQLRKDAAQIRNPHSYFCGIVRHKLSRYFAQQGRPRPHDLDDAQDPADPREGPPERAVRVDLTRAVDGCLRKLDAVDRQILKLRFNGGKTFEEIGIIVRLDKAQVHRRTKKALERLRQWLSGGGAI